MEFRLTYRGALPAGHKTSRNAYRFRRTRDNLQAMRRGFHSQLRTLWEHELMKTHGKYLDPNYKPDDCLILEKVGPFLFAPLVTDVLDTLAKLDVLLLRPEPPGHLFRHGGDIDNRVKTLVDALRMPKEPELPDDDTPQDGEDPFFCLLKDDALVTRLAVDTDTLLDAENSTDVSVLIRITVWTRSLTFANIGLAS